MTLTTTEKAENAIRLAASLLNDQQRIAALEKIVRELANELDQTVNFCADI